MIGALTPMMPLLAAAAAKKTSGSSSILLVFIVIGAAFYFLIYRPQQRKAKAVRQQGNAFDVGDEVLTAGGIVGYVIDIDGDRITLETSVGASFVVLRQYVLRKIEEPVADDDETYDEDEHDPEDEHDETDHGDDHADADDADDHGGEDEDEAPSAEDKPANGGSGKAGRRKSTDGNDESGGPGSDGPPII
jgi:preprotein translocase subunit YajC